jgi:hypothetical protein
VDANELVTVIRAQRAKEQAWGANEYSHALNRTTEDWSTAGSAGVSPASTTLTQGSQDDPAGEFITVPASARS